MGATLFAVCRLPVAVASLVEYRLWGTQPSVVVAHRLSNCVAWAYLPWGMWNLSGAGIIKPVPPALAGRFFTEPLGKPQYHMVLDYTFLWDDFWYGKYHHPKHAAFTWKVWKEERKGGRSVRDLVILWAMSTTSLCGWWPSITDSQEPGFCWEVQYSRQQDEWPELISSFSFWPLPCWSWEQKASESRCWGSSDPSTGQACHSCHLNLLLPPALMPVHPTDSKALSWEGLRTPDPGQMSF